MTTESHKPVIFISYAHADEPDSPIEGEVKWLSFVIGYLRPAAKHGGIDIWVDRLMRGGDNLDQEIERKLRACDIFVLLVSRHSLSSDYIVDKEIALIRERQSNGEDVYFYPLLLTPTPKIALDLVRDKNLRPRDAKPFSDHSIDAQYRQMSEAADEIAELARESVVRKKGLPLLSLPRAADVSLPSPPPQSSQGEPTFVIPPPPPASSRPRFDRREPAPQFDNSRALEEWLKEESSELAVAIAVRAVLRIAPVMALAVRKQPSAEHARAYSILVSAVFRACALARVSVGCPNCVHDLNAARHAAAAAQASATDAERTSYAAAFVAAAAAVRCAYFTDDVYGAADGAGSVAELAVSAAEMGSGRGGHRAATAAFWREVQSDLTAARSLGIAGLADLVLWRHRVPRWASGAWGRLKAGLPKGEEWDIWVEWYEERLRGGSRGEFYEIAFIQAPPEVWDKGPAATNEWIKNCLSAASPSPNVISSELVLMPLREAAIRAHDRIPNDIAEIGRSTFAGDDPAKLVIWWCYVLAPKLKIMGYRAPSRKRDIYSDCSHRNDYDLLLENEQIVARARNGKGFWTQLCVYAAGVDRAIEVIRPQC